MCRGRAATTGRNGTTKTQTAPRGAPRGRARYRRIAGLDALKPTRMNLDLGNVTVALERMGHPERSYPAILVSGTNGKGSVTTYASSILRAAGLRVGSYYSPHIFRPHERIRIDGDEIPSADLDRLIGHVRARARGIPLTYFEVLTAVAAAWFRERRVDAAVFEVGLGGRLDATNLVNAAVTVVTGISLDHREHLGATAAEILDEKLGIARPTVPLAAHLAAKALEKRAAARCARIGAPFHPVGEEARSSIVSIEAGLMRVRLRTPRRDYGVLETRMIGAAQARNVATAVRTAELFADAGLAPKALAGPVRRGVAAAFLAGRFQQVSRAPRIVLDVSHNEESLLAALDTVGRIAPRARTTIVFGVLAHKELGSFPGRAVSAARTIVVTRLSDPRSAPGRRLGRVFEEARARGGGPRAAVRVARGVGPAVREACRRADREDTILILGSHLMVEEAAPFL